MTFQWSKQKKQKPYQKKQNVRGRSTALGSNFKKVSKKEAMKKQSKSGSWEKTPAPKKATSSGKKAGGSSWASKVAAYKAKKAGASKKMVTGKSAMKGATSAKSAMKGKASSKSITKGAAKKIQAVKNPMKNSQLSMKSYMR